MILWDPFCRLWRAGRRFEVNKSADDAAIDWIDIRKLSVEGQGWQDIKAPFDRLPNRADGLCACPSES